MVVQALEAHGDIARTVPPPEVIEGEEFEGRLSAWVVTASQADAVHAAVSTVSDIAEVHVGEVDTAAADGGAAPAQPAEAAPEPDAGTDTPPAPAQPQAQGGGEASAEASGADKRNADAARKSKPAATVRVGTDKLDSLMNLMGEMVIHRTRLWQLSGEHKVPELRGAVEEMTRVTNDLQTLIMAVRMMPVEAVFMRFPRMVRDLAHTLGKRLELEISGEDTELDRTVIDELGDPLVHMTPSPIRRRRSWSSRPASRPPPRRPTSRAAGSGWTRSSPRSPA
jgi:two-component system chemotaxis sensor kinase CheA